MIAAPGARHYSSILVSREGCRSRFRVTTSGQLRRAHRGCVARLRSSVFKSGSWLNWRKLSDDHHFQKVSAPMQIISVAYASKEVQHASHHRIVSWHLSVMRTPVVFPPLRERGTPVMLKRQSSIDKSLKERLASFAHDVRRQASQLPPGPEKDQMLRKARQADTAAHLDDWANSPGLRSPE